MKELHSIEHNGRCRLCGIEQNEQNTWPNKFTSTGLSVLCEACSRNKAAKIKLMQELSNMLGDRWQILPEGKEDETM
jgi:hypothetical protein